MNELDSVGARMRQDWDRRARDDAGYYVAFGRRRQSPEEFFASAADVLRELSGEFARLGSGAELPNMAALEIGCGPGRLMLPLSETFGSIAGVDVSREMVELARANLRGRANADVRVSNGSDLSGFDDASADFVYSYAVFQHIPDREVVLSYLREAVRVLKPGGILKCQVNSLPRKNSVPSEPEPGWTLRAGAPLRRFELSDPPDTWSGVSFAGEEIAAFAAEHGLALLAMDGFETQYLWFTARKPGFGEGDSGPLEAHIGGITNTFSGDRLVPCAGRFAGASLWIPNLPSRADLNCLRIEIDGKPTAACFIGHPDRLGAQQVNVYLPPGVRTGVVRVRLVLDGEPISDFASMRVVEPAPLTPRLTAVSDGVNLLSRATVDTRALKLTLEEVPIEDRDAILSQFEARIDDVVISDIEIFCVDPLARRYEMNLRLPDSVEAGERRLHCRLGGRRFPERELRVAP